MLLGTESNHALEGGGGDALVCLVARGLCLFVRVDASKAPDKERRNLAALAVRRAAPFPDPEFGVAWEADGQGAAWYWSRSRVQGLLAERGVHARRTEFVPEALYAGATGTGDDGIELLELHDGVEARVWRNARLVADRWWPAAPSAAEWQAFLRSAGLPGEASAGAPQALPAALARQPWSRRGRPRMALSGLSGLERHLPRAALGLGLVVVLVASVQLGSILRSRIDIWRAQQAAEALDEPLKRILAARESSDRDMASIAQVLALHNGRSSVVLLAEAARLLPGRDWQIRQWNQPTPERIEVTLAMPDADPQKLVATWEESPMFADVTTDLLTRSGEVVIRASVLPATGPAAP
ncbi:hypothetical protein [Pseudoxanthomonas broegbernensis]|nr:hypothetical protein [Pseudoxanthomonas broegbernensis]MBB6063620.1 hypothetical protein [Pseudoxanthomonas broegbernensis]